MRIFFLIPIAMTLLAGCATAPPPPDLGRQLAGQSQISGAGLERRIAAASRHPLGSRENPVRAEMPLGQRAYLQRLRCGDGRAPSFSRIGNFGIGIYGNIIDGYRVDCASAAPGRVEIYMDMYHRGHVEDRAVPGFNIMPVGPIAAAGPVQDHFRPLARAG
jgi:hypothetical protein